MPFILKTANDYPAFNSVEGGLITAASVRRPRVVLFQLRPDPDAYWANTPGLDHCPLLPMNPKIDRRTIRAPRATLSTGMICLHHLSERLDRVKQ